MNIGILSYTARLLLRSPGRSLALVGGLALGVALVVSVLLFVQSSSRQLTQTAIAPVTVDMIGHATTATVDEAAVVKGFRAQPGVTAVEPLDVVDFTAASKAGVTQKTPAGKIVAIDPSFLKTFNLLGVSSGSLTTDGVLISDATATRLGLKAGDTITIEIPALSTPFQAKVTGILDTSRTGPMFVNTNPANEGEFIVVSDVVVMDRALFNKVLRGPLLGTVAPPSNPATAPAAGVSNSGTPLIDQQQYIKIDRAALPANPNDARIQADRTRRGLERLFTGEVRITNNLGDALNGAKSDVLNAKILFIFLGLPGVALAIFLARYASELYGEAQRREIGLLRARGASTPQVLGIAGMSAALLGITGSALGIGIGTLVTLIARRSNALADASLSTFLGIAPWALAAGLLMALISSFVPTWAALRQNVMAERRRIKRTEKPPLWKRMWLDVAMLVLAGLILFVVRLVGGFKPTGGEGQAISFSFYLFLAPLFLWIGLTLFLQRVLLRWIPILANLTAGRGSGLGQVAARGMGWRANRLSSAITVIALTLSFGVSLALFTSTYAAEKRTGAEYAIGADVRVTPALGTVQDPSLEQKLHVPGVRAVTGVTRDTKAIIGSENHSVYGIDVATFKNAAFLPNSFVEGGDAAGMLAKLAATPNGVLVNREEATKFNILVGDPVLVRMSTAAAGYVDVRLQAVGIIKYFPTSTQDSSLIMNRAMMVQSRGSAINDFYLINADGTTAGAAAVSAEIAPLFNSTAPAHIQDLKTAINVDQSSLTSLNLGGLGTIERIFTLVIAFAGFGIFLLAAIAERAKEYSTMRAVGASPGQLRRLLLVEGGSIMLFGVVLSVPAGFLIASVLITLLTSIFLLPVGGLSISMGPLVLLIAVSAAALAVALGLASQALSRLSLGTALREE